MQIKLVPDKKLPSLLRYMKKQRYFAHKAVTTRSIRYDLWRIVNRNTNCLLYRAARAKSSNKKYRQMTLTPRKLH